MPHVVTTRHDLLINHVFTIIHSSLLSPNTAAIVVGTVHVRRLLRTKAACRHLVSLSLSGLRCLLVWLMLFQDPMLPRPRGSQPAGCVAGQIVFIVSCRVGWVEAVSLGDQTGITIEIVAKIFFFLYCNILSII